MKFLFLLIAFSSPAFANSFSEFGSIPVQNEGRVKPLDSFARSHLLAFNSSESVPGLTPAAWLAEVLFEPDRSYERQIFDLPNPDTVALLGLERRERHRYSFQEIFPKLREQQNLTKQLREQPKELRTPAQNQLLELDVKAARFFEISRSVSLLIPLFKTEDPKLAFKLGIESGKEYSYMEVLRLKEQAAKEAKASSSAAQFLAAYDAIEGWPLSEVLRVFPPQFRSGDEWISPWRVVQAGDGSPAVAESLRGWRALAETYHRGDWAGFSTAAHALRVHSEAQAASYTRPFAIEVEQLYNSVAPFQKAVAFYIGAFLCLLAAWLLRNKKVLRAAFYLMCAGFAIHGLGILARIFVLGRPPVSTLYESVIFVTWIAVLLSFFLERSKGQGLGTLIGSVAASALLFVSFGYAAEGDTMGVLVAVLNTNFWLATHVVCITIGYGTCLVGGVLGHVYLLSSVFGAGKSRLQDLFQGMLGVSLVALFFAMFGTILGGIWADQSWGRFWGWDPKENGALLIVLWLLFLMHGRLSGRVGAAGYALGMVFTNVVVALAWFGVNLLNVGLHSYGFTDNIALNLLLFCLGETTFGLLAYHHAKLRVLKANLERISHFTENHPEPSRG